MTRTEHEVRSRTIVDTMSWSLVPSSGPPSAMTSGRHDESSVAILFFTHVFDRTALRHLKQLKDQTADSGTLFVYCDVDGQAPPPLDIEVVRFHFPTIRQRYPRILGTTLVPGNCHLTLLEFAKRYPQFQHYWVIEYNVEFAGHWQQFFSAFAARAGRFRRDSFTRSQRRARLVLVAHSRSPIWRSPDRTGPCLLPHSTRQPPITRAP